MLTKKEARQEAIKYRKSLSKSYRIETSDRIAQSVLALPEVKASKNVCVYLALEYEVETAKLISDLQNCGKALSAPKTMGEDMYAVKFDGYDKCVKGNFNVLEPIGEVVDKENLDVIIVPLVAFNRKRARIGYGKGYYDRFLPNRAVKIGVAFSGQEFDFLPEAFDKTLDVIVTEKEIIR